MGDPSAGAWPAYFSCAEGIILCWVASSDCPKLRRVCSVSSHVRCLLDRGLLSEAFTFYLNMQRLYHEADLELKACVELQNACSQRFLPVAVATATVAAATDASCRPLLAAACCCCIR